MSFNIVNPDGSVSQVAGNGKAEYGASTVRRGTATVNADTTTNYVTATVTFADPMPDNDYDVTIYMTGEDGYNAVQWIVRNKSASGFQVTCATVNGQYFSDSSHSFTFSYAAFKLYADLEYNRILSVIPSSASSSNKLATAEDVPHFSQTVLYNQDYIRITDWRYGVVGYITINLNEGHTAVPSFSQFPLFLPYDTLPTFSNWITGVGFETGKRFKFWYDTTLQTLNLNAEDGLDSTANEVVRISYMIWGG